MDTKIPEFFRGREGHLAPIPHYRTPNKKYLQRAHLRNPLGGLVRLHEAEERFGVAIFSFANQASAFDRMARPS